MKRGKKPIELDVEASSENYEDDTYMFGQWLWIYLIFNDISKWYIRNQPYSTKSNNIQTIIYTKFTYQSNYLKKQFMNLI
jgi:hypothetical protein